jgi:hypothetical protein
MANATFGLPPSATLSKGRVLQRTTVSNVERCLQATNRLRAGAEKVVGVSMNTVLNASTEVSVDIATPGQWAMVELGGTVTALHHYLTFDAVGRTIGGATVDADIIHAANFKGQAGTVGEFIEVFLIHNA